MDKKEYIDRSELIKVIGTDTAPFTTSMVFRHIRNAPAADVVEVVRCKDCQFWQNNNGGYPHPECRWGRDETPDADDYCSFGERREDNA